MADTARGAATAQEIAQATVSEAQIAVHWREEEYFEPPGSFVAQANAKDPAILGRRSGGVVVVSRVPACCMESCVRAA